jgi:hypothetical protein
MQNSAGLNQFVRTSRSTFTGTSKSVRIVYVSDLVASQNGTNLASYVADKAPLFYRDHAKISDTLGSGFFISAIKETLIRLPTSKSFQESHFGEIVTAIFAEEVIGLKKLYSKLSLLTSENSNAYKMDLVLYKIDNNSVEFVFGEVKSSPKVASNGCPVGHDKSCYADIFNSLNGYSDEDLQFDLSAVRDQLDKLPEGDRVLIRKALMPYANPKITYAGFAIIDSSTRHDDEMRVLCTRKNKKAFDIDVICVERYPDVASGVFKTLEELKKLCSA